MPDQLKMTLESGDVIIRLRPDLAPAHAARLVELADSGFYDGIVFHPTYEGKVIRYLNGMEPEWWTRDDKTLLWVVGGPLP